jgi:hypothetical protein
MSQKRYRGWRLVAATLLSDSTVENERHEASGTKVVVIDNGQERDLDLRLDVRDHSPTGFNWGYGGSGPAQLALAICCDCLGDKIGSDPVVYQQFKRDFVSGWDVEWEIPEADIRAWAHRFL